MTVSFPRLVLLVAGCVVHGVGVAMLLSADLGSDGYSTLVNGASTTLGVSFLSANVAAYLGSLTGAGPTEAAALAWDPPVPFRRSYSLVQGGGALAGWLLRLDLQRPAQVAKTQ